MNIKISVLTDSGKPRRQALIDELPNYAEIFNSSLNVDFSFEKQKVDQLSNKIFLGRELTENEIKCLLSHAAIITKTLNSWSIVLEDDSIINSKYFLDFMKTVEYLQISKPAILLLYIGKNGVFSKINRKALPGTDLHLAKCLAVPTGAVGYAINPAAADELRKAEKFIGSADWPTWARQVSFFGVFPDVVKHDFTIKSLTQTKTVGHFENSWPPERFKMSKMLIAIIKPRVTSAYGGVFGFFILVIRPALYRKASRIFPLYLLRS
jgi:hypothetical protein